MVDPKLWAEAKRIFGEATELPEEEREPFAREACIDEFALRELVERLLAGDNRIHGDAERAGLEALVEDPNAQADPPVVGVLPTPLEESRGSSPDWARDAGVPFQPDTLLIDRYRVLRRLERGGMGVVYAAQDIRLQRQVALKFLPEEWSRDDGAMKRFVREARAASALDHPNICTVHEIAELESHELFIVMAFYEGESLDRKIRRGDLSIDEAIDVTIRVARALEVDPDYALAHSGLADAYPGAYHSGEMTAEEAFGKARLHARRAIELDDTIAEAYTSLMRVALEWDWDWDASERYIHRALELNPNYAIAHHWLAWYFATVGRFDEALEQIDRAHLLDPLSSKISGDRVRFVYLARRYEEAIKAAGTLLEREPDLRVPRRFLARALMEQGRPGEAVIEFERVVKSDASLGVLGELGHIYAVSGKEKEASRLLNRFLEEVSPPAYSIALIHLGLGRQDNAFEWLDRAFEQRSIRLVGIKADPRLDPLRSDPRFTDLLKRMKLDDRSLNGPATQ